MPLEIEQKFPLVDAEPLVVRLQKMGAEKLDTVQQCDTYYNHPSRDFAVTDEALRIRQTPTGAHVTYKGPKLDAVAKTRREIELPLESPESWPELLAALGFGEVATVRKQRKRWNLCRPPFSIEICIDHVDDVGTFSEIEIVTNEAQQETAQEAIAQLAEQLELKDPESRSYLEMLLACPNDT